MLALWVHGDEVIGRLTSLGDLTAPTLDGRYDLRFVLIHLINETARHAGHADAVRELLDGTVGE